MLDGIVLDAPNRSRVAKMRLLIEFLAPRVVAR